MRILQESEIMFVGGGNNTKFAEAIKNATKVEGGDTTCICYDQNNNCVRGYHADDWNDANWFCCSGRKGDYMNMVYGVYNKNCKTGAVRTLSQPLPCPLPPW